MKQAILIEGLFSFGAGYVRNVYKKPLEDLGYKVTSLPWTADIPDGADLIIAHSFGAGYLMRKKPICELLITMDARRMDFWNNSKLHAYIHYVHINHCNFFQSGLMRGWPIKGAINKEIKSSHVGLPAKAFDDVMEILR